MPRGVYPRTEEHRRAASEGQKRRDPESFNREKCPKGCTCYKHVRSEETKKKISDFYKGLRFDRTPGVGFYLDQDGYRILTGQQEHPISNSNGELRECRRVLYEKIGPGPHNCHWCSKEIFWSSPTRGNTICSDHLDGDVTNDTPENLVESCFKCNWDRGNGKMTRFH